MYGSISSVFINRHLSFETCCLSTGATQYCSKACLKADKKTHKRSCALLANSRCSELSAMPESRTIHLPSVSATHCSFECSSKHADHSDLCATSSPMSLLLSAYASSCVGRKNKELVMRCLERISSVADEDHGYENEAIPTDSKARVQAFQPKVWERVQVRERSYGIAMMVFLGRQS